MSALLLRDDADVIARLVRPPRPGARSRLEPPLDLTASLAAAAHEVCALVPDVAHVRVPEVHFTVFRSREARRTLTFARCYPLPWAMQRRGRRWFELSPVYTPAGHRARYLLAFAWPRFWALEPRARLETLLHELYHISPAFDGEARTFAEGGWHGRSRTWFDAVVHRLAERHLPAGFEDAHPALSFSPADPIRVTGEPLRRPAWQEQFRSL